MHTFIHTRMRTPLSRRGRRCTAVPSRVRVSIRVMIRSRATHHSTAEGVDALPFQAELIGRTHVPSRGARALRAKSSSEDVYVLTSSVTRNADTRLDKRVAKVR